MKISEKECCWNCLHMCHEHQNLGYDHFEKSMCVKHRRYLDSDNFNTTCIDFQRRNAK
jgi:hypothetical protein